MAQKNINIGTGELTGDGETLRGAFSKIEDNFTELYGSSGGLTEIVQDTTPQLGGNLDMNGFDLVTTELNKDIILETHGTGDVLLKGDKVGIGSVNQPDTTLHLKDTNSVITLQRTADANTPGLSFQNSNGNVRGVIKLDGTGGTSNEIFMETYDGATQAERFRVTHTGAKVTGKILYSNSYASIGDFPTASSYEGSFVYDTGGDKPYVADSNGWVNILTENDSIGSLSNVNTSGIADGNVLVWNSSQGRFNPGTAGTSGISNVVEDTTPELGGDLNVGGNSIVGGNNPINLAPGGTASINLSADETITTGKILYSNMYAQLADLPNATTYHGMFAHVHATGKAYYAHGGNWIELANQADIGSGGGGLDSAGVASYLSGNWDFHLLPETNASYDIGSAEYKVRHLFLSDNSLFFDSGQTSVGFEAVGTSKNLKFNNNVVKEASYVEEAAGVVDLSKTNHFVTTGATYDLANGEYVGQELKFWHKTQGGTNIVRVNVSNAKWRNGSGVLTTIPNMMWDQDKENTACYGCIWDGEAWIIGEGSLGA